MGTTGKDQRQARWPWFNYDPWSCRLVRHRINWEDGDEMMIERLHPQSLNGPSRHSNKVEMELSYLVKEAQEHAHVAFIDFRPTFIHSESQIIGHPLPKQPILCPFNSSTKCFPLCAIFCATKSSSGLAWQNVYTILLTLSCPNITIILPLSVHILHPT